MVAGPTTTGHLRAVPWHARDADEVVELLETDLAGLRAHEAAARLGRYGPNRMEEEPPPPGVVVLLRQFRSPLIYILLAALVITLLLGEFIDATVIGIVLVVNAVIGFVQERKAEGAVRALMQLVVPSARTIRDAQEWEIDSRELVPGDIVLLESGSRVPADLRLIAANDLKVDESLLTGESVPVTKQTHALDDDVPLADRTTMAYTGAIVTSGRGRGVVVGTGADTELGSIAGLMRAETEIATPLQHRMDRFAKVIGVAVGASAIVAFTSGIALGEPAEEMFLVAVALAVSAVPEGLPVAVTITLAVGVSRMARRNAIIRRLPAVETLGSTTTIGSDKTGTLTENRMTVEEVWTPGRPYVLSGDPPDGAYLDDGEPARVDHRSALHLALLTGSLTSEAHVYRRDDGISVSGDPTEVALLLAAMSAGIEPDDARQAHPTVVEIPFEPARRYAGAIRVHDGARTVFVTGAPERVADMCSEMLGDTGPVPVERNVIHGAARDLAGRGLRVLAMAYRPLPAASGGAALEEPRDLVFLGLQGMLDPPRPGVPEAVAACQAAGIRVVMITGDHALTGRAIASRIGIAEEDQRTITGVEIRSMDDDELRSCLSDVSVFARVSPDEKLRIVKAFQERGDVVAVTGDGVNDAPALKAAQIGIAMGRGGTDVAREAADMVLADDNFVSITAAVEEGRVTFDNIRKVTFFLVSTGAAEVAAILTGVWLGWPLVLLPAQLLWLNLVTNGLQDVALAFEPGEKDVLARPPRRLREGVLSRMLWQRTALAGLVMAAGTLAMFRWEFDASGSLVQAQTMALSTMVVFQVFQAGNARSDTRSLFRLSPISNPFLFAATAAAVSVHVLALYLPPTQYVLRVEPIAFAAWMRIIAVAASVLVVVEGHKVFRRTRRGGGPGRRFRRRPWRARDPNPLVY